MSNKRVWVTKSGAGIKIKNMGDDHLRNSARLIIGLNFRRDYLEDMIREIRRRKLEFSIDVSFVDALRLREIDNRVVRELEGEQKVKTKKSRMYTVLRRPKLTEAK